jgi:hypothetical protein
LESELTVARIAANFNLPIEKEESMNWTRVILGGIVGGVVLNMADFVMHGLIMGNTYTKYPVFAQEPANPLWFFLVAICIGLTTGVLFGRTRAVWPDGLLGGVTFGFFLGLVSFFSQFYYPLVLEGFPYYMSWCWGGINMIGFLVLGGVLGLIYKRQEAPR